MQRTASYGGVYNVPLSGAVCDTGLDEGRPAALYRLTHQVREYPEVGDAALGCAGGDWCYYKWRARFMGSG